MKNPKKFALWLISLSLCLLLLMGGMTALIDPYFHYHAPLPGLAYPLTAERYQNDGILRHFDYDTVIIGSSMTENFRASQCDELFSAQSVKACTKGATYKEASDSLRRAFEARDGIKRVIWAVDGQFLMFGKDELQYKDMPYFMTDDNIFNDVNYLFNKSIFLNGTLSVIYHSLLGERGTDFDAYANWSGLHSLGREAILGPYLSMRPEKSDELLPWGQEEQRLVYDNVMQNIVELAAEHPETEFYCFFPPYSIYYWDEMMQRGGTEQRLQAFELAAELMLEQENIRVFSYFDRPELITDPDNYIDTIHYGQAVSDWLLEQLASGQGELSKQSCGEHFRGLREYFTGFDYSTLF